MDAVVDDRLALGELGVIVDDSAQRLALELVGEGNDGGVAAAGCRDAAGLEIVRVLRSHRPALGQMHVAVNAARDDDAAAGIDAAASALDAVGERGDAPAGDADIAAHHL